MRIHRSYFQGQRSRFDVTTAVLAETAKIKIKIKNKKRAAPYVPHLRHIPVLDCLEVALRAQG
jgi:hypothetical protein